VAILQCIATWRQLDVVPVVLGFNYGTMLHHPRNSKLLPRNLDSRPRLPLRYWYFGNRWPFTGIFCQLTLVFILCICTGKYPPKVLYPPNLAISWRTICLVHAAAASHPAAGLMYIRNRTAEIMRHVFVLWEVVLYVFCWWCFILWTDSCIVH